ncbi:MAG: LysR family transcriptional regulator [Clostridium sp.]|jgi:DNA-binding transcriptional LysR family regulator
MFQSMHYIYEVYKEMNFSKAAKNLYISQPSLSAAVKKEEQRLGFPIFDRSTNPIQLTEFGQQYIRAIEQVMDVERSFENFVNDINDLKIGSVSIGATNLFASHILPPILSRFTEKYPAVRVNLMEASTTELTEKLLSGSLDLIIENTELDPLVYGKAFFCKEHMILTVPKKFESNQKAAAYALTADEIKSGRHLEDSFPSVPLQTFAQDPFLFLKSGNDTRTRADRICHNHHFTPNIKLKLDQQITAYNLTCYGLGISFNGDTLICHVPSDENLLFYKLDSKESVRSVNFYYKQNRYMTRAVREFLRCI